MNLKKVQPRHSMDSGGIDSPFVLSVAAGIFLLVAGSLCINQYEIHETVHQNHAEEKKLIAKAGELENVISQKMTLLYSMGSYVEAHFSSFSPSGASLTPVGLNSFLKRLYAYSSNIHSISIAPDGIHRYVYPNDGLAKKTLKHNLLNDDRLDVRKNVQQTIASGKLGISGPYALRQDGTLAIVARLPIYQNDKFWGFVVIVLDLPELLQNVGIEQHGAYALRVGDEIPFWGDTSLFTQKNVRFTSVNLPEAAWDLGISIKAWEIPIGTKIFLYVFLCFFSLILSRSLLIIIKNRQKLFWESESRYQSLFQNGHTIMLLIEPNTAAIVDANSSACEFYGYNKEALLAMKITDINQLSEAEIYAEIALAKEEKRKYFSFKHRLANGRICDVDVHSGPVRINSHDYLYSIISDVTDRKQTEKRLLDSEVKFQLLANHTYDWEYWLDTQGQYLYSSPSCERITGYSPQDFLDNSQLLLDIVSPSFKEQVRQHYTTSCDELSHMFEFSITAKGGDNVWLEHRCNPVFDEGGTYVGRRGNHRDITARKLVEQEQKRLLMAMDQSDDVIITTDTTGRIEYVNPAFEKVTGYTSEEVLGKNPRFLKSGQLSTEFYEEMWSVLKAGDTWRGQFINKAKDGAIYIESASISPVRDSQGKIISFVAVKRDMTKTIEAEKARKELELQLRQKSKMEAVGLLAGGMAHNFNNNLSIILGYVELLRMNNKDNAENIEFINSARIGIDRARDLIKQIMDYSRFGNQEIGLTDLRQVIDETLKFLQTTLPSSIYLKYNPLSTDEKLFTLSNGTRIQEALLNLCNNATHAMNEKGTLTITTDKAALVAKDIPLLYENCSPGDFVKVSVEDTGCGMDLPKSEMIFEPFFTTKDEDHGTGMGLATVQTLLRECGGMIKVDSCLGQGTIFELYFPIATQEESIQPELFAEDLAQGTERILLVDDDKIIAALGERFLSSAGYHVTTMTDSSEALELFNRNPNSFDLVVSDQTMPKMNGHELIIEMRKIKPNLLSIICTGYSSKISENEIEEYQIKALLDKPFTQHKLLQVVRDVLDAG